MYDMKEPSTKSSERKHMGFIAQELKRDVIALGLESSVYLDDNIENWGVDYSQFVAPLTKAIQELSSMILSLQEKVATLELECRRR
jgi:hypothetical protein